MSRRKARELAIQALYSYDVGGMPLDEVLKFEWVNNNFASERGMEGVIQDIENKNKKPSRKSEQLYQEESQEPELPVDSETLDFARILISGTVNHISEIDQRIRDHLSKNWDFDRVNKISLAVLRLSVYSLLFQSDVHPSIVIDEAVNLTKDFGVDEAHKFVNAVLDNINKEINK